MVDILDPRTVRARAALTAATRELVSERPVEDLSVTEVAALAGVSRPTVYQHFGDIPSLVAAATKEFMEGIFAHIDATLEEENSLDYVRHLLALFVEGVYGQRAFCNNAMHGASALSIALDTMKYLDDRMRNHVIGSRIPAEGQTAADQRAAISAGLVWMVVAWLDTDFADANAPEAFANRLANTLFSLAGVTS